MIGQLPRHTALLLALAPFFDRPMELR